MNYDIHSFASSFATVGYFVVYQFTDSIAQYRLAISELCFAKPKYACLAKYLLDRSSFFFDSTHVFA